MLRKSMILVPVVCLWVLCALAGAQDAAGPKPAAKKAPGDIMQILDGESLTGHIHKIGKDGTIHIKGSGGDTITNISQASSIRFGDSLPANALNKSCPVFRLVDGTVLTGKLISWTDKAITISNKYFGTIKIKPSKLKFVSFSQNRYQRAPTVKQVDKDVIFTKGGEIVCDVVSLKPAPDSQGKTQVSSVEYLLKGEKKSVSAAEVDSIAFRAKDTLDPDDIPDGWYAHIRMVNGDHFSGVLDRMSKGRIRLVTRCAGEIDLRREYVSAIRFTRELQQASRNLLVFDWDNQLLLEYDSDMHEVWSYKSPKKYLTFAIRLDNGNILATSVKGHYVCEINRDKKIVWEVSISAYRALRLPNGNTLLSLPYAKRGLVEVNERGIEVRNIMNGRPITFFEITEEGNLFCFAFDYKGIFLTDMNGKIIRQHKSDTFTFGRPMPGGGFAAIARVGNHQIEIYDSNWQKISTIPIMDNKTYSFAVNSYGNILFYRRKNSGYRLVEYSPLGQMVSEKTINRPALKINHISY